MAPKRSIFDLCDLKELDTITLKRVVTEHKSGISVLASPPDFTTVEMLNTETLVNAISLYRSLFDYIVIDTRTSFDEATLQILDVAGAGTQARSGPASRSADRFATSSGVSLDRSSGTDTSIASPSDSALSVRPRPT